MGPMRSRAPGPVPASQQPSEVLTMQWPTARLLAVQAVCLGSAGLSAAYYVTWAPNLHSAIALAAFAFCLDLVKPQLFATATEAAREWRIGACLVAGSLAFLLAIVSMIAVDGMILKLRTDSSASNTHVQTAWDRASAAYKEAANELASIGTVKPVAGLEAELEGSVAVDVWRRTEKCTDVTKPASRTACEPALRIREEIAKSRRRDELERKRDTAKQILDTTQRPAAADPQVEVLSRTFGWSEASILFALTWAAGLAVELVSCFGVALLNSGRKKESVEAPDLSGLTPEQRALRWVLDEIARSRGRYVLVNKVVADRFGVDPATVTRWRSKWVEAGLLDEQRDGKVITLRMAKR